MAASAPPAAPASVDADQLARLPLAVVIANELKTGATRVEANGELMVLKAQMPGAPAPVVFLLCQDWSYPLVGAPVLADAGRFILATDKGITFVVEPQQATELEVAAFSAVLSDLCEVHARADPPPAPATSSTAVAPIETEEEEAAPAASWGDKVAGGVAFAGGVAAFGLVKGAKLAGHGIGRAGAYLKQRMSKGTEEVEISEETRERLEKAKVISEAAMHVTGGLITGVTEVAMTLGATVADAMRDTSVAQHIREGTSSKHGQELMKVAGAGVHAFTNIWTALEESARTVGRATADTTSDLVHHKYGAKAAQATKDGFSTAGTAALSVFHVTNLGATAVASYTSSHGDKSRLISRKDLRDAQEEKAIEDGQSSK